MAAARCPEDSSARGCLGSTTSSFCRMAASHGAHICEHNTRDWDAGRVCRLLRRAGGEGTGRELWWLQACSASGGGMIVGRGDRVWGGGVALGMWAMFNNLVLISGMVEFVCEQQGAASIIFIHFRFAFPSFQCFTLSAAVGCGIVTHFKSSAAFTKPPVRCSKPPALALHTHHNTRGCGFTSQSHPASRPRPLCSGS